LGTIAAGAAAIGIATIGSPLQLTAESASPFSNQNADDADAWFKSKLTGKHKIMFDVTRPHEVFPFAWPKVFLLTNQATGSAGKDSNVVVVLRHDGIPYAFEDSLWQSINLEKCLKRMISSPKLLLLAIHSGNQKREILKCLALVM